MKLKLLALSALTVLSISSARADEDWGVHSESGEVASFQVLQRHNYDQVFHFSLDKTSSLKTTAVVNNLVFTTSPANFVDLFNFDTGEKIGYFSFGTTETTGYFNNLTAGNYLYEIYGANFGVEVGQVVFTSAAINAVPEAQTYALMLAGLGAVGFIARRRKTL